VRGGSVCSGCPGAAEGIAGFGAEGKPHHAAGRDAGALPQAGRTQTRRAQKVQPPAPAIGATVRGANFLGDHAANLMQGARVGWMLHQAGGDLLLATL
jgi:hypothetical protein